jgi:ribonuclease HII
MLKSYFKKNQIEVGCDEAGRGCLAGPVVAGAVILPANYKNKKLDDSKKLTEKQRNILRLEIEKDAVAYQTAFVYQDEIDKINILNASILAMHSAMDGLNMDFDFILIDGNRFKKYKDKMHECIIKGDGKYLSIAAASILAKTYRDEYMTELSEKFPEYAWNKNMGYPTKAHVAAIAKYGYTDHHRKSYHIKALDWKLF